MTPSKGVSAANLMHSLDQMDRLAIMQSMSASSEQRTEPMTNGVIPPFEHRCIIQSGDLAGNTYSYEITTSDVEYEMPCQNCGGVTTERQLILHIYAHLTGEN